MIIISMIVLVTLAMVWIVSQTDTVNQATAICAIGSLFNLLFVLWMFANWKGIT